MSAWAAIESQVRCNFSCSSQKQLYTGDVSTVQKLAKRGALVETSAMPLLLQGLSWGGGKRRKYAGSISWAHVACFEDWRKYWFWVWNSCPRIQMFQSLLVCLTLSHLESITRLRRLVLRIHPSAGACKYLAKRPNIVKSLKTHHLPLQLVCPKDQNTYRKNLFASF